MRLDQGFNNHPFFPIICPSTFLERICKFIWTLKHHPHSSLLCHKNWPCTQPFSTPSHMSIWKIFAYPYIHTHTLRCTSFHSSASLGCTLCSCLGMLLHLEGALGLSELCTPHIISIAFFLKGNLNAICLF